MKDGTLERLGPNLVGGIGKIQVGCGPKNLMNDWWNVDIRPFPGVDQVFDVSQPWGLESCVEYVYGEHFIEHLTIEQALSFLRHAQNALCVGGRIRLTTPSLEWVLKTHFSFNSTEMDGAHHDTWKINRAFHGWGHRFLYSRAMLEWMFPKCGFREISFYNYEESDTLALRGLERHGGWSRQEGYPSVWIVEGTKGDFSEINWKIASAEASESFMKYVKSEH